jgi:hypothetical protein
MCARWFLLLAAAPAFGLVKKGTARWCQGHPLIRINGNRFVASLFWMMEGASHEPGFPL